MATLSSTPQDNQRKSRKVAFAAFIGTTVEWYDFYIFSTAAALIFSHTFFPPSSNPLSGVMASFAAYGVGFFARPLGGIIAGHFGDRIGRKHVLVYSLILMGVSTLLTGLLPDYATAGVLSTVLLVVLRLLQGIATGAEWGGASLLSVEHATAKNRGFLGSFTQIGSAAGMLLASATFLIVKSLISAEAFNAWGWRLPFLFSIVLIAIGIFVRLRIDEPAVFSELKAAGKTRRFPVADVIRQHPRALLVTIGLRLVQPAMYAILTTYALSYLLLQRGANDYGLTAVLVGSAAAILTTPFWAKLSDKIGRRRPALFGIVGIGLFVWPFFYFLDNGNLVWMPLLVAIGLAVFDAAVYGPGAAWFSEQFPTEVRYSGISLGYQIGTLISGGLTPFIATWLFSVGNGTPWLICGFISFYALLSAIAAWYANDPIGDVRRGAGQNDASGFSAGGQQEAV
ncbi:MHS family MFS transporter [Affinibrenneria salicis]|uniref:MHS family MFS transporter n=1 Tax=Affinibrenneria salicis TaxID=2590031 RepID=A0A5J5FWC5_9GAMM|nr:MFS transporter [Affinibrenneria salicis]KAA8998118.1 MHS family MFS transporter [Affinibrenneria salicis]